MHDVAIVGGGPVGMLLAVLLAQSGRDVVVLEARDAISSRPRAMGIHPPAVAALAEAGVDVTAEGRPISEGIAVADGRELGRLATDGVVSLPQQQVERMLRARLETLAPGSLALGRRVLGLRRTGARIGLEIDGEPVTRSARLVVGADGLRSSVRGAAGIPMVRRRESAHYLMSDTDGDDLGDVALLCFERDGVVESFPLPGGRRRWVARVPEPVGSFDDLAATVRHRTGHELRHPAPVSAFTARQALARRVVAADIVLVGDAAHEISPLGGQGLNLGWLDARALARVITGDAEFARFDVERRRSARRAAGQAAFNMSMGRPLSSSAHAARCRVIRALARPPFAPRLAETFTMRTFAN